VDAGRVSAGIRAEATSALPGLQAVAGCGRFSQASRDSWGWVGELVISTIRPIAAGGFEGIEADPGHQAPRQAALLLTAGAAEHDSFPLDPLLRFLQATRAYDGPVETALGQQAFAQSFPHQDQTEQVEGMQQPAAAEGAHQHHPLHPRRSARLDLGANRQSIHLQRTQQIHRRARPGADHQGVATAERRLECRCIAELQANDLGPR